MKFIAGINTTSFFFKLIAKNAKCSPAVPLIQETANLTFRLVSEAEDGFGSELLYFENSDNQLSVSKRGRIGYFLKNGTTSIRVPNEIDAKTISLEIRSPIIVIF